MTKQTKTAAAKIASQMKVAAVALKQMKAAVKANDMKAAVAASKQLQAAADAADAIAKAEGTAVTDTQLKGLGYVVDPSGSGNLWGLDIPVPVLLAEVDEENKNG